MQVNPRKIMQQELNKLNEKINQVAGGLSLVVQKIEYQEKNMGGLEQIIMKLAEFNKQRDEFNKYLEDWLKTESKSSKDVSQSVNIGGDKDGDLVSGSSVSDKPSSTSRSDYR